MTPHPHTLKRKSSRSEDAVDAGLLLASFGTCLTKASEQREEDVVKVCFFS